MRALPILLAAALGCGGARSSKHEWLSADDAKAATKPLSATERAAIAKDGFAILSDRQAPSFHIGYVSLFHDHQPVYVTADSLLYAWHSSYDAILMQIERDHLIPQVKAMLQELRDKLAKSTGDAQARADVDVYLGVAMGLLDGNGGGWRPVAGGKAEEISALVQKAIAAEGQDLELMGAGQVFDWSMLKPRGHYEYSEDMQQYFRAMSWLGRVELRIAQKKPRESWTVDRRQFAAAKLLGSLFTGPTRDKWNAIDGTLASFVGPPDSMSIDGLTAGLAKLGGSDRDADIVAAFEKLSDQKIRTQMLKRGEGDIAFVTLGQRFVYDSKVFTDVTYGNLEAKRMMPTPLDVAYAVFDNPIAKPLLAEEMQRWGKDYTAALDRDRREAGMDPTLWNGSLYHLWLGALRGLSPDPQRDTVLPAPLTSDAWAKRMLNAQLASWAELRHDNLLYAKESFTAMAECAYPDAYVEPYPAFYAAMEALAAKGKDTIAKLPVKSPNDAKLIEYFDRMRATMLKLHLLADKERTGKPLDEDDIGWINHMVSLTGKSAGCTFVREPEGWYADLYYDRFRILDHQPIVADVHTQPTDANGNMIGAVLHVGTGYPYMFVAELQHDGGKHRAAYRGFVSSYGEEITTDFKRYTDSTWREKVEKAPPAPPAWLAPLYAH
jgi:hypothetical protein